MTSKAQGIRSAVQQTTFTFVPATLGVVALAEKIFGFLRITPAAQDRIVVGLLVSMPVVVALAWVFSEPATGGGWLARTTRTRRKRAAFAALPTVLTAALLVSLLGPRVAASSNIDPKVSVSTFRDDSPKGDHAYLANGLSEELTLALERVPGMQVMDGPDSASVIIEGTVSRWQDTLRITARLLRNADKRRLRSFRQTRTFGDVFAMQDALSQEIVDDLVPHIPQGQAKGARNETRPTHAAYDLYLRARYARDRLRDTTQAISLLRESISADPGFARARRELAALNRDGL